MKHFFLSILLIQTCYLNAQKLVSYQVLPCEETIGLNFYRNRIVSELYNHDTLKIEVSFVANCGIQYKGSLATEKDKLFLNFENISDGFTTCNCLFFMQIVISEISNPKTIVFINGEEFVVSNKKFIDLPPLTINKKEIRNQINDDGLKVGIWKVKSKFKSGFYYISDYGNAKQKQNYAIWRKAFDNKGKLISVDILREFAEETTYYNIEPEEYEKMLRENGDY